MTHPSLVKVSGTFGLILSLFALGCSDESSMNSKALPDPAELRRTPLDEMPKPPMGARAVSLVTLPVVEKGRVLRTTEIEKFRVVIDETDSSLSLSMEEPEQFRQQGQYEVGDTIKLRKASTLRELGKTPNRF